jgi:peptidoglycan/LPS O-acetylase OafA/YrhL
MNYRSEIDGLRAICILSVILYHAQFQIGDTTYFSGGFIGVDVFFVISGYLITRIILDELQANNTFNFLKFYEKRARRILPALIIVIFFSLPFAWLELIPNDLQDFTDSIFASLGFYSNFYFYHNVTQYGATDALLKPLLHTWSLAVEEQFYVFSPLLFFIIWRHLNKRLFLIISTLVLISLCIAETLNFQNSQLNFFHSLSRFWELLLGSSITLLEGKLKIKKNTLISNFLSVVGLALLSQAIITFSSYTPHPGLITVAPLVGVSLIILFCSKKDVVGQFLTLKPMVSVGLISYSLYLWHFPLFAFSPILSYLFVEKPFRRTLSRKWFYSLMFLGLAGVLCGTVFLSKTTGRMWAFPSVLNELGTGGSYEVRDNTGTICSMKPVEDYCFFEYSDSHPNLFIIGDSIAASLAKPFLANHAELKFNLHSLTRFSCFFAPNANYFQLQFNIKCDDGYQSKRLEIIKNYKPGILIFSGDLANYLYNDSYKSTNSVSWQENFKNEIQNLINQGHKIVFVYPSPGQNKHLGKLALQLWKKNENDLKFVSGELPKEITAEINKLTPVKTNDFMTYSKPAFELLDSFSQSQIIRVYPHKIICDEICHFAYEGNLFYIDKTHFSAFTREKIFNEIIEKAQNKGWLN